MEKLFDGLHSGRYSRIRELQRFPVPEGQEEEKEEKKDKEEEKKEVEEEQRGVTPRMLKKLICKDHIDFGGMQQQDAYEFFQFLLKAIQRNEKFVFLSEPFLSVSLFWFFSIPNIVNNQVQWGRKEGPFQGV